MRRFALVLLFFAACAKPQRPNVILVSIDTLRADRLGRGLTPNLDALARESIAAVGGGAPLKAWSHCPLTLPSHVSVFTGLLPPEHGVRDNAGYRFDGAKHPTLASLLRANGYRTAGAVSAYVLRGDTGASTGFDEWDDAIGLVDGAATGSLQRDGRTTLQIAKDWIAKNESAPFFYFLHLYEPHTPYAKSYDGDVADADAIAGDLIAFLKERKLYDNALIVVLSDHGEGLADHGEEEHGVFLYREALEVPLLIKLPSGVRRLQSPLSNETAQLIDVLPTILDALDLDKPKALRGSSLLREMEPRAIYAESFYPRLHLGWSELRSVIRAPMQYIEAPRPELYDLQKDPAQRRNVLDANRRDLHALRAELESFGAAFTAPTAITKEEERKLAALGYVSAGASDARSNVDPKDRIHELARLKSRDVASMESLLAANPQWSDVRDQLGIALANAGEHERAARVFEEGITATPKLAASFALSAATELFALDRFDDAEKRARFAADSGIAEAHLLLGELALARGDLDGASAEARNASRNAGLAAHALFLDARIAAAKRDFVTAVTLLSKTQHVRQRTGASLPKHFHYAAGDVLARLGRMNEARQAFEAEIARDPKNLDAYTHLASVLRFAGDANAAKRVLRRMIQANPTAEARELARKHAG